MSKLPLFVGLDYHSMFVQVCVLDGDGKMRLNRKVDNCARAIEETIRQIGSPSGIALEACCGAANLADELRQRTGWRIQLAHPGYVARMKGSPDKTDFGDAQLLADLLRVGYLPTVWLAPEQIRELRRLIRFRDQLVRQRRNAKLRIRALLREHRFRCESFKAWTKGWLSWLKSLAFCEDDRWMLDHHLNTIDRLRQEISATETRLRQRATSDVVVQKLLSLEGVGLVTAMTLRSEIAEFDRFSNGKKLARFCSVTPRNASSGQRQADAGLVKAGSSLLRSVIIETAHRLVWRLDSHWSKLASKMLKRGKPKCVVIAAIANRWVRWLHHQLTVEGLAS